MTLTAVLDANAPIGLAKGGVFHHLETIYAPLYIPSSVVQEVVVQGQGRPGAAELQQALGHWITEVTADRQTLRQFSTTLPEADREVLAVAQEHAVDHLISGDERLVREAVLHGLICVSVTDVVVLLKREDLIPTVGPVLDQMRQNGFGINTTRYQRALQSAGE